MIYVLGANGMLGRYMFTYLRYNALMLVNGVTRKELDARTATWQNLLDLGLKSGDVIINCVGVIPQRQHTDVLTYIDVNAAFPHKLTSFCEQYRVKLIHITTDCVYDGTSPIHYTEESVHTATDVYGRTKSLGEPSTATCIRTSIIGEELRNQSSLLEWVRFNDGNKVKGYTNHLWNGVTCLQLAKICRTIIEKDMFWSGTRHIMSPRHVSKYKLITMIASAYDLELEVTPFETDKACNRTLDSVYSVAGFNIPTLEEQLQELSDYSDTLRLDHE